MSSRLDDYSVVLASAGTGKTFQLSNRFLYVIAREPTLDPAKVLATTFTRKAAGEILDRVLQRLSEAALSEKKAAELDGFIGLKLGREGYVALCVRVAGAMHRLAIQTIDAFTARVVGALGLDRSTCPPCPEQLSPRSPPQVPRHHRAPPPARRQYSPSLPLQPARSCS